VLLLERWRGMRLEVGGGVAVCGLYYMGCDLGIRSHCIGGSLGVWYGKVHMRTCMYTGVYLSLRGNACRLKNLFYIVLLPNFIARFENMFTLYIY